MESNYELNRIADALKRIAEALEASNRKEFGTPIYQQYHGFPGQTITVDTHPDWQGP